MSILPRIIFAARRLVLGGMCAVAGWFLVFGPRPGDTFPRDTVVVEYWEKWTGHEAEQMKSVVSEFNQTVGKQKHIYVRYLAMSNIDQKTLAACAAGVPPDVAGLWERQLAQFASLDALEPLEDMARVRGITEQTYKPIYWKECNYDGHLWCLISTPSVIALHYHKGVFRQNAAALRKAGLDPGRPPRTLQELDRYAQVLDERGANGRLRRLGYLPMEPGWYLDFTYLWFGGEIFDSVREQFTLTTPQVIAAFEWIKSYSVRLGRESVRDYRDSVGQQFNTPQNPFMSDPPRIAMELQGPWMANFIHNLTHKSPWAPSMSELLVPQADEFNLKDRQDNQEWAAAPFPSAVPGLEGVSFADCDCLAIPRRARHKQEAFEFIAYVNRQDVMERLCAMHCKNSPLRNVSRNFIERHPNPYIGVFEELANSPNARGGPQVPMWLEVHKELDDAAQAVYLLHAEPADALRGAERRLQEKYDRWRVTRDARRAQRAEHPLASLETR